MAMTTLKTSRRPTVAPNAAALVAAIRDANPDAVAFDLFDTLLIRACDPEDVKRIACEKVARIVGLSGRELYATRARIERELCERNAASGHDFEFRFDAMAARLAERIAPDAADSERAKLVSLLRDCELAVEASVQHVDADMLVVLTRLAAERKPLYLLSDFYLPAATLARMLDMHRLLGHFAAVFISCDTLQTKRSGHAYERLLQATGCDPGRLLMIGDNPVSDFDQAREHGLMALLVDRRATEARYRQLTARFDRPTRFAAAVRDIASADARTVFPELSLPLFYFVQNLHTRLVANGARDVFFLSREGQLLKRLFDHYQAHACFDGALLIRSHYLESSRRASFMPSLGALETETFDALFRQYRQLSLAEFLTNLGLDDLAPACRAQFGPAFDARTDDLRQSADFDHLLQSAAFRARYAQRNREQYDAFIEYLKQFERAGDGRTLHLVDVGWKGTIQDNIFRMSGRDARKAPFDDIDGYYMALLESGSANARNRKHGLLFNAPDHHVAGYPAFNENRSLFEVLLAADHGSAQCYGILNDGRAIVRRQYLEDESRLYHGKIAVVQHDLTARFERLCDFCLRHRWTDEQLLDSAVRAHARMVFSPTRAEVEWFTSAYHLENFGVFDRTVFHGDATRQSFAARVETTLRIFRSGLPHDLGVWPWLTLCRETLAPLPLAYKLFRYRQLRQRRKRTALPMPD